MEELPPINDVVEPMESAQTEVQNPHYGRARLGDMDRLLIREGQNPLEERFWFQVRNQE